MLHDGNNMKVAGIDFSLTATGVAVIEDADSFIHTVKSKPSEGIAGFIGRVRDIATETVRFAGDYGLDLIVIEAPAFSARGSAVDKMFGGWWLMVAELIEQTSAEILTVPPTSLKKFATGKGNAGKDEVMLAAAHRFPDVKVTNNNETDALWLAIIGTHITGNPFGKVPASHLVALEKLRK